MPNPIEQFHIQVNGIEAYRETILKNHFPNKPNCTHTEFLGGPFASKDSANSPDATVLGAMLQDESSTHVKNLITLLAFRSVLGSGGRGVQVLPSGNTFDTQGYLKYAIQQNLLSSDAPILLVSPDHFYSPGKMMATLAKNGIDKVEPYQVKPDLISLGEEHRIKVGQMQPEGVRSGMQHYDKAKFRDWFAREVGEFSYPRFTHSSETPANAQEVIQGVSDYQHKPESDQPTPFIFMQDTMSGGGVGNLVIFKHDQQLLIKVNSSFQSINLQEMLDQAANLGKTIELTPYLDVKATFTTGFYTDKKVSMVRDFPTFQLITEGSNDYQGFVTTLPEQIEDMDMGPYYQASKTLAQDLAAGGYTGWGDIDWHIFNDPEGNRKVAPSEANIRWDGTTQTIRSIAMKNLPLYQKIISSNQLFIEHDHVHLPAEAHDVDSTLAWLKSLGIPLLDINSQKAQGAIIKGPPFNDSIGIALVGDEEQVFNWTDVAGFNIHYGNL